MGLFVAFQIIFKKSGEIHKGLWIEDNTTKCATSLLHWAISTWVLLTDSLDASGIQQINQFFLLPLLAALAGVTAGTAAW